MDDHRKDRLRELIKTKFKGSRPDFIEASGLTKGRVTQLLDPELPFGERAAASLTEKLRLPTRWFDQGEENNIASGPEIRGRVPLISWVRAGDLCECGAENISPEDAEEWFECPVPHSKGTYCLRVVGDSMDDGDTGYRDGEIIFVDPEVEATPGRDVVVRTPENKSTFKRLKSDDEGLYLLALNGKRIIRVPEDTVFCGVVIFSGIKR